MRNSSIINKEPQEILFESLNELDNLLYKVDDDLMNILAQLFSIDSKHSSAQKMYFQNILIPHLYKTQSNFKDNFSELVANLYIIKEQIEPKKFFNRELISSSIYYFQFSDEETDESDEISIKLNAKTILLFKSK